MNLTRIFNPWSTIRELEADLERMDDGFWRVSRENAELRAQIAKFDHDGDGKPGGSRKRK